MKELQERGERATAVREEEPANGLEDSRGLCVAEHVAFSLSSSYWSLSKAGTLLCAGASSAVAFLFVAPSRMANPTADGLVAVGTVAAYAASPLLFMGVQHLA